jgi:hypothetical protein
MEKKKFKQTKIRVALDGIIVCFPGVTTHCGCIFTAR